VPVIDPSASAGVVRASLIGRSFDEINDLAVCETGRLVGLVTIEALMAAPELPDRRHHG
jgi:hypothetical protein